MKNKTLEEFARVLEDSPEYRVLRGLPETSGYHSSPETSPLIGLDRQITKTKQLEAMYAPFPSDLL